MKTSPPAPTVPVATRVNPELAAAVHKAAADHDVPVAVFLRRVLAAHDSVQAHLTPARPKRRLTQSR